jgi:hypothetical protein
MRVTFMNEAARQNMAKRIFVITCHEWIPNFHATCVALAIAMMQMTCKLFDAWCSYSLYFWFYICENSKRPIISEIQIESLSDGKRLQFMLLYFMKIFNLQEFQIKCSNLSRLNEFSQFYSQNFRIEIKFTKPLFY